MNLPARRARLFLLTILALLATALICAVTVNAYVDPLWLAPHLGERSSIRYCVDDERQNKINKMVFGGVTADAVLIGTSRSAFFDTRYFKRPVFNLAVNGLRPVEASEYLRIFVERVGAPKDVYLGLDFVGYIQEEGDAVWAERAKEKERTSLSPGYRLGELLDLGTLVKSIDTVFRCSRQSTETPPTHRYNGVRDVKPRPRDPKLFEEQLQFFVRYYYGLQNPADERLRERYMKIRQASPSSTFHAFIPPISAELFRALIASGRSEDYKKWIAIVTDIFGPVTQFSGVNSFTADPANFYDAHHVYPERTVEMIAILEGRRPADSDGFGRTIAAEVIFN